ncbi:MAG: hypothetical protein ACXWLM_04765 [Myxococcales bacterium]
MQVDDTVPSGLEGIRSDLAHFCKVHQAGAWSVLLRSRAFWGLAVYRFGRWVYARPRTVPMLPLRGAYNVLFEIVRRVSKTSFSVCSFIEREVWFAPQGEVFVSFGTRIGRGSMLHGENTLGIGGRARNRGQPKLGERVTMCPGAAAVGPVEIPAGSVIGPNALIGRTLPHAGLWMGVPPRERPATRSFAPPPRSFRRPETPR